MNKYISYTAYLLACMTFGMGVMLLPVAAQDDEPAPADGDATAEEVFTQGCAECHLDVVADWQDSPHATAYEHEDLQTTIAAGEADTCLECHATGYQPFSGEFTHANVSCEACHGSTPVDHPDEPISVQTGVEVCADCHTTSFQEWEMSAHGAAELDCVSCHDPHAKGLRFETSNQLCTNCHETADLEGYSHETHTDQACTDCHWHHGEFDNAQHISTGILPASGHDAQVETRACTDCHAQEAELVSTGDEDNITAIISGVPLREMEAELANVRAQGENLAAVRLIQGGVMGLAFGAVMMFGFIRLRPGRRFEEDE